MHRRLVVTKATKRKISLGLGASILALGVVLGLASPTPAAPEKAVRVGGGEGYDRQ
jgi:hypothetical protein